MTTADIIIVGAGITGLVLAKSLAVRNIRVCLIDQKKNILTPSTDHRQYALSPGNLHFLTQEGIISTSFPGQIVKQIIVRTTSPLSTLSFSADAAEVDSLAMIVTHADLYNAALNSLEHETNCQVVEEFSSQNIELNDDSIRISSRSGEKYSAQLLIGADGSQSWVRQEVGFSSKDTDNQKKFSCITAKLKISKPHMESAWQWFTNNGVIALLPMKDNSVFLVWTIPTESITELTAISDEYFMIKINEISEDVMGNLHILSPRETVHLHRHQVNQLVQDKVILIGDAAHVISPISGQGLNLGLRDIRQLLTLFTQKESFRPLYDPVLLQKYSILRSEDMWKTGLFSDGLLSMFLYGKITRTIVNCAMNLTNTSPQLKTLFIKNAAL